MRSPLDIILEQTTERDTEAISTLYTAIDELSNKPTQPDPNRRHQPLHLRTPNPQRLDRRHIDESG